MSSPAVKNFMLQQGFAEEPGSACALHYSALTLQPRVIALLAALAILSQAAPIFLALSLILWWNVALPRWNVFELFYNRVVAAPRGKPLLGPAPAPRVFSQGMAATFMLLIGVSLLMKWTVAAIVLQGFLAVALLALIAGRFCLGAYIYQLLRGKVAFANSTLPWARSRSQPSGSARIG